MPSARVVEMFARAGYHAGPGDARRSTWCARLGTRWFVRPTQLVLMPRLIPRWSDLSVARRVRIAGGVRPQRWYRDLSALPWDLVRVRDKERAKLSLFDLRAATKTVVWDQRVDLERELATQARLVAGGVSMLPFMCVDEGASRATQALQGAFLASADSLDPIADQLLAYARATATPMPVRDYLARVPEGEDSRAIQIAGSGPEVPMTVVHGDLSSGNIVRDGAGAWLIDLDRAFTAAATYDFVYAWVTRGERERPLADRALEALVPGSDPTVRTRLGLAWFVCDSLAYLAECSGEAARKHTVSLVRAASSLLAATT